jgi:hypothetical protein
MTQATARTMTTGDRARMLETAADTMERASDYVRTGVSRLGEQAQVLGRQAGDRVAAYRGVAEDWARESRDFVRRRPLYVLAGAVLVGYVAGKILMGRR